MDLFDIVANLPSSEKRDDPPKCPFCESMNISTSGTMSTLVGSLDGVDRNHKWTECQCDCGEEFVRESKGPNAVWYTKGRVVLTGMPECFEQYEYQCKKCGGPVSRMYTDLDGKETESLVRDKDEDGRWIKKYKTFFRCKECGHGGETEDEYYVKKGDGGS